MPPSSGKRHPVSPARSDGLALPATTTGTRYVPSSLISVRWPPFEPEQARGLVDDPLEDVIDIREHRDPRADLAQRPLRLRALRELGLGALELADQARVRDRGGGVVGERADEPDVRRREMVGLARVDPERAEDRVAGDERRHDHRAQARVRDRPRP